MHTMCAGVYLSLKGVVYANNSAIQITEIGETDPDTDLNEGLQCITDRMPCCRFAVRTGEWYMYTPGRTVVPGPSPAVRFYRNRGYDDGTVNLNRPDGVTMPTGVDSSCPTAISSLDEPVCGEKEEEECLYDNDPKYAMCAQHLANDNVATCFEGCVVRNG